MYKYKFIVIPSPSTFKNADAGCVSLFGDIGPIGISSCDFIVEMYDLSLNFCLLFNTSNLELADYYLHVANFNLRLAIETYQFDIC